MLHMFQSTMKKFDDMIVVQRVIDKATFLAGFDNAQLAQVAQMMRDRRFTDWHGFGNGRDILFTVEQGRNDTQTTGITQRGKELGQMSGGVVVQLGGGGNNRI